LDDFTQIDRIYIRNNDDDESKLFQTIEKGLQEFVDENQDDKSVFYLNLATIYIDLNDRKLALNYLKKIIDSKKYFTIEFNLQYSRFYRLDNNFEKAIKHAEKALQSCEENKDFDQLFLCCTILIEFCPKQSDFYIKNFFISSPNKRTFTKKFTIQLHLFISNI